MSSAPPASRPVVPGDTAFQPRAILDALVAHGVRFVLIGGLAATVHGSPLPTEDVDVTPEGSAENLARLSGALMALGARVRAEGVEAGLALSHDAGSLAAVSVWNLTTKYGDLDLSLIPSGTTGYADLARGARSVDVMGLAVPVASLADVIRSKQAANRPKDQRALPVLREILARGLAE